MLDPRRRPEVVHLACARTLSGSSLCDGSTPTPPGSCLLGCPARRSRRPSPNCALPRRASLWRTKPAPTHPGAVAMPAPESLQLARSIGDDDGRSAVREDVADLIPMETSVDRHCDKPGVPDRQGLEVLAGSASRARPGLRREAETILRPAAARLWRANSAHVAWTRSPLAIAAVGRAHLPWRASQPARFIPTAFAPTRGHRRSAERRSNAMETLPRRTSPHCCWAGPRDPVHPACPARRRCCPVVFAVDDLGFVGLPLDRVKPQVFHPGRPTCSGNGISPPTRERRCCSSTGTRLTGPRCGGYAFARTAGAVKGAHRVAVPSPIRSVCPAI